MILKCLKNGKLKIVDNVEKIVLKNDNESFIVFVTDRPEFYLKIRDFIEIY